MQKYKELKQLESTASKYYRKYLDAKFPKSNSTLGSTGAFALGYMGAKMGGGDNREEANRIAELPNDIETLKIRVITLENNLKKVIDDIKKTEKEIEENKAKISREPTHESSPLASVAAAATGYGVGKMTGGYKKTLKKRNRKNKTRRNLK